MTFWETLIKRVKSKSPRWFRKTIVLGATLVSVGTAGQLGPESMPQKLKDLSSYLIVAGTVMAAVAKTATTNNKLSEGKEEEDTDSI